MKKVIKIIGISLLSFVLLIGIFFATGVINLQFSRYFGVRHANVQREIYKENKSYVEGMASDLANYKYQLSQEKDATARKAICDLIRERYANFDINNLDDVSLQKFLQDVKNGEYDNMEVK